MAWFGLARFGAARPGSAGRGTARYGMEHHDEAGPGRARLGGAWHGTAWPGMEHHLMAPFAPKGEVAQWRIVYRAFQQAAVGDTVTYQQLGEALDLDPLKDRHQIQAAARRAGKQFLAVDDRAVEVEPDVGYRLVSAVRQIPMAGQQVERAERALAKGHDLTTHIRMEELSEQERQIVHTMALGFAQVAEWARQIGRRVEDHEGRLADVEAELERLRKERGD